MWGPLDQTLPKMHVNKKKELLLPVKIASTAKLNKMFWLSDVTCRSNFFKKPVYQRIWKNTVRVNFDRVGQFIFKSKLFRHAILYEFVFNPNSPYLIKSSPLFWCWAIWPALKQALNFSANLSFFRTFHLLTRGPEICSKPH